jgi:hypothetical protein
MLKRSVLLEKGDAPSHIAETVISSCTLLSSGASFLDLEPTAEIRIPEKAWGVIREYYYKYKFLQDLNEVTNEENPARRAELESIHHDTSVSYDIFTHVILGLPSSTLNVLPTFGSTFAVLGNDDPVVPDDTLLGVPQNRRTFPILHVPALRHAFSKTDEWRQSAPMVAGCVAGFMRSCVEGPLSSEPLATASSDGDPSLTR